MAMIGNVTELSLVDLIQMACIERDTARLIVEREQGRGSVFFDQGEIVHAQAGDKEGPEALYEILSWTTGNFRLDKGIKAEQRTVSGTWTAHLLEALVRIDNTLHRENGGESRPAANPEPDESITYAGPAPEEVSPISPPDPPPDAPPATEPRDWLAQLATLDGVEELALVTVEGQPHERAPDGQSEETSALTAFIGNAAREIGRSLNLGSLDRASVTIAGTPRVVLWCGQCYAGLRLSEEPNAHRVAAQAQDILRSRKS